MKFRISKEDWNKILVYSLSLIIAIIAYLLLARMNDIWSFLSNIVSLLVPFIGGFGIAFVLNPGVIWMENRLYNTKMHRRTARILAIVIIYLLFLIAMVLIIWIMIPSLIDSMRGFAENIAVYATRLENMVYKLAADFEVDPAQITAAINKLNLEQNLSNLMQTIITRMMSYSMDFIHAITNIFIALAAGFYMLMDRDKLLSIFKKLSYSVFSRDHANFLTLYAIDARNVFQRYITGNLLDSLIVGLVCWVGMIFLNIPYAPMIGFIVGITNIIPVFGPFLGAIPVILLLLLINPMDAVIFAIFILVLQQIDGNVLKPVILGDKLGLSGFWILFSVTIGGALFGIPGMFLGAPIFALIYEAIADLIDMRLKDRHLDLVSPNDR